MANGVFKSWAAEAKASVQRWYRSCSCMYACRSSCWLLELARSSVSTAPSSFDRPASSPLVVDTLISRPATAFVCDQRGEGYLRACFSTPCRGMLCQSFSPVNRQNACLWSQKRKRLRLPENGGNCPRQPVLCGSNLLPDPRVASVAASPAKPCDHGSINRASASNRLGQYDLANKVRENCFFNPIIRGKRGRPDCGKTA